MNIEDIKEMEWYKNGTPKFKMFLLELIDLYRPRIGDKLILNHPECRGYTYTRVSFDVFKKHRSDVGYKNDIIYLLKSDGNYGYIYKSSPNIVLLEE